MRLTLANLKAGRTPHVLGVCADDPRLVQWLNEAQERLMNCGRWWGTVQRALFCVTDNCLTWPREVATIEAAAVCDEPVPIRNMWYEFRSFGNVYTPGEWRLSGCAVELVDHGMSCTVSDISGTGKKVIAYATNPDDEGKRILVQGRDENGNWIRTEDSGSVVDGEYITLSVTGTVSTHYFDGGITGIQKDPTDYEVLLYQYDTSVERLLGRFQPDEVNPMYRRSYVTGATSCCGCDYLKIEAIVTLQHVPVSGDLDWFILQNETALKLGALAVKLEEIGETQRAEVEMKKAIRELQRQLDKMTGQKYTVVATGHGSALPSRMFRRFI